MTQDEQLKRKKQHARRYQDSLEKSGDKSIEFWRSMNEDARDNFHISSDWAKQASDTCLDMMKIGILVGSIYIAIIRFGLANPLPFDGIGLASAGLFLIVAVLLYIQGYNKMGDIRVAGNMDRLNSLVNNNSNEKEMLQSVIFDNSYYGHLNGKVTRRVNNLITWGTVCLSASVSSMVAVIAL